jgi:O-antigen/teichoic acid export membrane protein
MGSSQADDRFSSVGITGSDPTTAGTGTIAAARRAVWGAGDQAVYSLTNFALTVLVAGSVGSEAFGAFAAVYVVYTLLLGISEALTAEVLVVVHSASRRRAWRSAVQGAAGCALALGSVVGLVALLLAGVTSGPLRQALPAFAILAPAMFLQDLWRFALFACQRPRAALVNDLTWAVVQTAALAALKLTGHATMTSLILGWGAGGVAGAILGMVQTGILPNPALAWQWFVQHRSFGVRFAGEWGILYGSAQVVLGLVGIVVGLAALGSLKAAQVLFGPLGGLVNGIRLSLIPLAIQVNSRSPRRLVGFIVVMSCGLALIAGAWTMVVFLLPASLGQALLGASWPGARAVLPAIAADQIVVAVSLGPLIALRAKQAARTSFRVRAITGTLVLILGTAGALSGSALAAASGLAAASVIGLVLLTGQAFRAMKAGLPAGQESQSPR